MALTAKNRAASAASASISGKTANSAALLTRMSTAPSFSTVVAIIRSQSAASATSAGTAKTRRPHSSSIALAAWVSVASVRPAIATRAPSRAKARAIAKPIPAPPPVTTATLPSNSPAFPPPPLWGRAGGGGRGLAPSSNRDVFVARPQFHKSHPDRLQHAFELAVNVLVRETENSETLRGNRCRTSGIISYFFVRRMCRPFNLNDQASVEGGEVSDKAVKDNLTPKAESGELLATKTFPETSFGIRCVASEAAGKGPQSLRHGADRPPHPPPPRGGGGG